MTRYRAIGPFFLLVVAVTAYQEGAPRLCALGRPRAPETPLALAALGVGVPRDGRASGYHNPWALEPLLLDMAVTASGLVLASPAPGVCVPLSAAPQLQHNIQWALVPLLLVIAVTASWLLLAAPASGVCEPYVGRASASTQYHVPLSSSC